MSNTTKSQREKSNKDAVKFISLVKLSFLKKGL